MKKKLIKFAVVFTVVLGFGVYFWNIAFCYFIPWTRTHFASYDKYISHLDNRSFYASRQFIDEIPDGSSSVKYYCRQVLKKE